MSPVAHPGCPYITRKRLAAAAPPWRMPASLHPARPLHRCTVPCASHPTLLHSCPGHRTACTPHNDELAPPRTTASLTRAPIRRPKRPGDLAMPRSCCTAKPQPEPTPGASDWFLRRASRRAAADRAAGGRAPPPPRAGWLPAVRSRVNA